jgi:hypothetical protein
MLRLPFVRLASRKHSPVGFKSKLIGISLYHQAANLGLLVGYFGEEVRAKGYRFTPLLLLVRHPICLRIRYHGAPSVGVGVAPSSPAKVSIPVVARAVSHQIFVLLSDVFLGCRKASDLAKCINSRIS